MRNCVLFLLLKLDRKLPLRSPAYILFLVMKLLIILSAGTDKGDNDADGKSSKPPTNVCNEATPPSDLPNGSTSSADAAPPDAPATATTCMEVEVSEGTSAEQVASGSGSKEPEKQGIACTTKIKTCDSDSARFHPKSPEHSPSSEDVDFKVIFSKSKYDITFPLDDTVAQLKDHLEVITGKQCSCFGFLTVSRLFLLWCFIISMYSRCSTYYAKTHDQRIG